jgi:ABC-type transporter Mla maintaining outer membrane lipid asymmetry permease subunit MlaE
VVLSWFLVKPAKAESGGFLTMALWFLILAVAVGASLLTWRSSPVRGPRDHSNHQQVSAVSMMIAATLIVVLGVVIAFLSGDKFDTIRAAAISGVLIIMNYPRRHWRRF